MSTGPRPRSLQDALGEPGERDEYGAAGLAAVLAIVLLFFDWVDASYAGYPVTHVGTGAPDGWLGVLAMLAALAFVADVVAQRYVGAELPVLGGSRERTRLILAAVAGGSVALKFVLHLDHFGDLGAGFWLALLAAAGLAFLAARLDRATV
jgi:hypothetical protein